eukprot:TRINITY_DN1069_c0_g1_i1.p1 TRINITY_DN1069_c0_g1~~TRINITY_DN1069_c0_g1_i1.p1  ORF type:complete len:810 (-),score=120.13 TRINITY_DN1069_c0_g1_i1:1486-3873(-)
MRSPWLLLLLLLACCAGTHARPPRLTPRGTPAGAAGRPPGTHRGRAASEARGAALLARLGAESGRGGAHACATEDGLPFICVNESLPLDHFNASDPRRISVMFQVLPAYGEPQGALVLALGGPGVVSHLYAPYLVGMMPPVLLESFDIVFFDQRGVGESCGFWCPASATEFYTQTFEVQTDTERDSSTQLCDAFANACMQEMRHAFTGSCIIGSTESEYQQRRQVMPFLGTRQAVRDLEAFREHLGVAQFALYGWSYGTQFAQTYAAVYPTRMASLVLDGTVDLSLNIVGFTAARLASLTDAITELLTACAQDAACSADVCPGDPRACAGVFSALDAQLRENSRGVPFPLPSGESNLRSVHYSDLEFIAEELLYYPWQRSHLLRALARAQSRGDWTDVLRWLYVQTSLDESSLRPAPQDPSALYFSDAAYYVIEALDYSFDDDTCGNQTYRRSVVCSSSGSDCSEFPPHTVCSLTADGDEGAHDFVATGVGAGVMASDFATQWFKDVPSAFLQDGLMIGNTRPTFLTYCPFPVLVTASTIDPATPYNQSVSVYEALRTPAYLVTVPGGPHGVFLSGNDCVDRLVSDFFFGTHPASKVTLCPGEVFDQYDSLTATDAHEFDSASNALYAADIDFHNLPEYLYWDPATSNLSAGCHAGGNVSGYADGAVLRLRLCSCAFTSGFALTGIGEEDAVRFALNVSVAGIGTGQLYYVRVWDAPGGPNVTGTWDVPTGPHFKLSYLAVVAVGALLLAAAATAVVAFFWTRKRRQRLSKSPPEVERSRSPAKFVELEEPAENV